MFVTGFEDLRMDPRDDPGKSDSECSTVQPRAKSAFKLSFTGSLYLSFS